MIIIINKIFAQNARIYLVWLVFCITGNVIEFNVENHDLILSWSLCGSVNRYILLLIHVNAWPHNFLVVTEHVSMNVYAYVWI